MRWMAALAILVPVSAVAWERLHGPAIEGALTDRSLSYDQFTLQHFRASGVTEYITERYSQGRWAVRGDQYCSVWPPSDVWACYDVEVEGDAVRFIGADGSTSEGTYIE